jgi:hypothetical protein
VDGRGEPIIMMKTKNISPIDLRGSNSTFISRPCFVGGQNQSSRQTQTIRRTIQSSKVTCCCSWSPFFYGSLNVTLLGVYILPNQSSFGECLEYGFRGWMAVLCFVPYLMIRQQATKNDSNNTNNNNTSNNNNIHTIIQGSTVNGSDGNMLEWHGCCFSI